MENKNMQEQLADLNIRNRAIRSGAALAAIIACMGVNGADLDTSVKTDANGSYSTHTDSASRRDANFIKEAAKGGQMEIKLGQLAADHSQNAEVKRFGERLVKDHSAANEELTKIAQAKGVDLTKEADRAGTSAAKEVDKFSNKSGADFDKAYIKYMISDHKKDISKFEKESTQSNDSDVRAFAQKTLPTLREHLRMAEDIGRSLGIDTASYSTSSDNSAAGGSATVSTERGNSNPSLNVDSKTGTDKSSQGSLNSDSGKNNASTRVDTTSDKDAAITVPADTKPKTKWFSTDKNDGKLWGIFPAPHHKNRDADVSVN